MNDRVLIDTSVWINYFRNITPVLSSRVDELLLHDSIFVPKVVIAELSQGAHSEKELAVIKEFLDAFHIMSEGEDTWFKAGKLSYILRKKGKTVSLTDCYISIMAEEHNCAILTLDKHFKDIEKESSIKLIVL
jgi:predicted nucleic acid-binding protein